MPSLEEEATHLGVYLLSKSFLHRISNISAKANCTKITLSGSATSYYQKQLAQELAQAFLSGRVFITNTIIVKRS
jgi:hypothetical protein